MDQSDQSDLEEIVEEWFRNVTIHNHLGNLSYVDDPLGAAKSLVKYILDKQYEAKVRQEREATGWCQLCEEGVKHEHRKA